MGEPHGQNVALMGRALAKGLTILLLKFLEL